MTQYNFKKITVVPRGQVLHLIFLNLMFAGTCFVNCLPPTRGFW